DHHVLALADQHLTPHVTEIIDHRPIDKSQWGYNEDTRTTIERVGSCATLVAQRIKDLSALFAKDEVNKGTRHDEEMVLFLEAVLAPADHDAE
ncbi:Prune, partial [Operophtera brumata]